MLLTCLKNGILNLFQVVFYLRVYKTKHPQANVSQKDLALTIVCMLLQVYPTTHPNPSLKGRDLGMGHPGYQFLLPTHWI